MALYLYHCSRCKQEFEVEKPMTQAQLAQICLNCGGAADRIFTAPGIQVKGAKIKFDGPVSPACEGCQHGGCDRD